jgi:glycosyltransferase involved in cell wall biosynthesis
MHGGAVTLAREFLNRGLSPDLLLATDMLDVTTLLSLTRKRTHSLKVVLYMHENQLTYPLPEEPGKGPMRRQRGERDLHYAFINYSSMLTADGIVFNSQFHMRDLFGQLPRFLGHFPEFRESQSIGALRQKSTVLPVGINWESLQSKTGSEGAAENEVPLILWNQRWEYDKNMDEFLSVLETIASEGLSFKVALCGQSFQNQSESFLDAIKRLGSRIIHLGFADEPLYHELLAKADITVSTAFHEFFGISIVEAVTCRVFPIVPARLSYPEIIPDRFHSRCLYSSRQSLLGLLRSAITDREGRVTLAEALSDCMKVYDWRQVAPAYDRVFDEVVNGGSEG